jgi:hypothetical protein
MAILNTHATVKTFIKHGFSEEQAEVIVEAINDQSNQLATKQDLYNLELKFESKIESINTSLESKIESINVSINWLKTISIANLTIMCGGMLAVLLPYMAKFF